MVSTETRDGGPVAEFKRVVAWLGAQEHLVLRGFATTPWDELVERAATEYAEDCASAADAWRLASGESAEPDESWMCAACGIGKNASTESSCYHCGIPAPSSAEPDDGALIDAYEALEPASAVPVGDDDCVSCGEADPRGECPKSKRACGHHCNHLTTHDACDWCGVKIGEDGAETAGAVPVGGNELAAG